MQVCSICNSYVQHQVGWINGYMCWYCRGCNTYYIEQSLADHSLFSLYNNFYSGQRARKIFHVIASISQLFLLNRFKIIQKNVHLNSSPLRFLDIGCGAGHCVYAAQKLNLEAYGIDIDKTCIDQANALGLKNIFHADLLHAHFRHEFFHVIQLFHVLEHIQHHKKILIKAREILTNNGVLIIDVPNQNSLIAKLKILFGLFKPMKRDYGYLQPPFHIFAFTLRSLKILLSLTGFEIVKIIYYSPANKLYNPSSINYKKSIKWFIIGILYMIFGRDSYVSVYATKKRS